MSNELVLVTGGSGFIGSHTILQLLTADYRVRTTVRSLAREADVRAMIRVGGGNPAAAIEFVEADLNQDAGWPAAVAGCDYVLHVASPFPISQPKDEDELIRPARDGALRVLAAARDAGVKRVVLTSSFAAVGYGPAVNRPFTEEDWTDPNGKITAYTKSKTVAERAAWDFMTKEGGAVELAVVNPSAVFGPALSSTLSTSIQQVRALMTGTLPGLANISLGVVDVRDVAALHILAMTSTKAAGQRFIAVSGEPVTLPQIAEVLRRRLGPLADRVPTRILPDWFLRTVAIVNPAVRTVAHQLGAPKRASSQKAIDLLGWTPIPAEDAIVASATSLEELGLLAPAAA